MGGLESQFLANYTKAVKVVCRAFNNRRNIFFINNYSSIDAYTDLLSRVKEKKELVAKEKDKSKREFISNLDEDEYDKLPEEDRLWFQAILLKESKIAFAKRKKEEEAKLEAERLAEEEERRRIEEEQTQKKGRKKPKPSAKETDKMSVINS